MIRLPLSTYRVQFTKDFGFAAARDIVPYLKDLGISDLYASPIFKAREGSTHGYDVVDHNAPNPQLGTTEEMESLSRELRERSMGWLQDIVPNHMAYHSDNRQLMDVLENGPQSQYINFFDIEWNHHDESLKGKLLAPILGGFFGECLENGDITLEFNERGLFIRYFETQFPLRIDSYAEVLGGNLGVLRKRMDRKHPDYVKLMGVFYILKNLPERDGTGERDDQIRFIKSMLWELYESNPVVRMFMDENVRTLNGSKGNPGSFKKLSTLLSQQYYRLAFWRVGVEEVNYRRFFAVNDLISLRVEDREVFDRVHHLPFRLLSSGIITGLRVDHIDGLYNPQQYLQRLREGAPEAFVVVEKILAAGEPLKPNWPIQGTTGYEYLNAANALFCMSANADRMDAAYRNFTGIQTSCGTMANDDKRLLIEKDLYGGLENLVYQLKAIASRFTHATDFTLSGFRQALEEAFVHFPVYRTYINEEGLDERDRQVIAWTMEKARASLPSHVHELNFIERMLLAQSVPEFGKEEKKNALEFSMRLQQFTSPLMAKGIEDTFLYVYNRLVSLNEVGGNPDIFGSTPEEFHAFNRQRLAAWPHSLSATATHDTKRGEDMRARINVISELPDEWEAKVAEWHALNKSFKHRRNAQFVPDRNDEYFLYQTLVGAWPMAEGSDAGSRDRVTPEFRERVREYLVKAVREAKVHTVWLKPDREYEEGFLDFLDRLLGHHGAGDPGGGAPSPFLASFLPFQRKAAFYGMFNGLSQALLKIASPGIPDFYQGDELWDLSMVDPDNRRPVDYAVRKSILQGIRDREASDLPGLMRELLARPEDGRCKLFLIYRALKTRASLPSVFQYGEYLPMGTEGTRKDSVVAFARTFGKHWCVSVMPRLLAGFVPEGRMPLGREIWGDTRIKIPGDAPVRWVDAISGEELQVEAGSLAVGDILARFPAAMLEGQT
ncbi:MAG: malto-oligosyltrehalose synthase [Fibrobacteres bacterium]|nr:malto-oligosyltrehalose synthase [Fibrobacterota bacterium]